MKIKPSHLLSGFVVVAFGLNAFLRTRRKISFRDRVILITGGSRGLGLILAEKLAEEGARIAICARNEKELELAEARIRASGAKDVMSLTCDVSRKSEVLEMINAVAESFGHIDVLVNNASIISVAPLDAMNRKDFQDAMATNFWGTLDTTWYALRFMKQGSRVMNITSIGGTLAVPHLLPYSCAKFAVAGFSQGLRAELAQKGILVTTVVPGLMRTGSFINALFKGERRAEMNWFALGSTLPMVSMNAERAARQMIEACRYGQAWATIGMPAKLGRLFNALFPSLSSELLALVNSLLPAAPQDSDRNEMPEPGKLHRSEISSPPLTLLGDIAALKFNEKVA